MNFDTLLVEPAMAATATPVNLEALGSFPLLQLLGGFVILAIGVMAFVRGQRATPVSTDIGTKMFFDGPVIHALNKLSGIKDGVERVEESEKAIAEQMTRQTVLIEAYARSVDRNSERMLELTRQVERHNELTADLIRRIDALRG